jgi:hypothetical protein
MRQMSWPSRMFQQNRRRRTERLDADVLLLGVITLRRDVVPARDTELTTGRLLVIVGTGTEYTRSTPHFDNRLTKGRRFFTSQYPRYPPPYKSS